MLDMQHDLITFATVVLVDLALAGDNAIAIVAIVALSMTWEGGQQVLEAV